MSATPTATSQSSPRKSSVIRKSSNKPRTVQSAIVAKRLNGESKSKISRDLGVSRNTVTSIMELNGMDQLEKYREETISLTPLAIDAVRTDLSIPGNGSLGLRFLESAGVIGDNALEAMRRNNARQTGAINVLVQAGATVITTTGSGQESKHNHTLADPATTSSDGPKDNNIRAVPANKVINDVTTVTRATDTPVREAPKSRPPA